MTTAEKVAGLFYNDGQCFSVGDTIDGDGCPTHYIEDVMTEEGATIEVANRLWDSITEEYHVEPCSRSDAHSGSLYRYAFPDGSAIVIAGDAWDIEGETPFSWAGA